MKKVHELSPDEQMALMAMPDAPVEATSEEPTEVEVPEGTPFSRIKRIDRPQMIGMGIHKQYDIIRVNHPLSYWYKEHDDSTYSRLDDILLQDWVRDNFLRVFGTLDPNSVKNAMEMVKVLTTVELDKIDKNWAEVVKNKAYWSKEKGELCEKPDGPCFVRLFDTDVPSKHIVKIPPFKASEQKLLWDTYKKTKEGLASGEEFDYEPYQFITTWAKGNHDVYLDIVRSIAYCFVEKKPVGSYVLVGLRRNGKSSFVGLLHTIFGFNNTSMLRLSQLGDPHYTKNLTRTLLNAPDEEDEKAIDAQASFKTISDHGVLNLGLMYKDDPEPVHCDFMSFYPMNHIPEWTGSGASACMKRTLVIPFYADLSQYDKSNYNFAEETFTSTFMAGFMGYIFGYANYYSTHELEFSPTMKAAQESIEEELDSAVLYREAFEKFFDGFSTMKFLFDDYCNWCKAKDMVIRPRKEFKFVFREYTASGRKYYSPDEQSTVVNLYRLPLANHQPLYEEMPKLPVGDINWLHESNCSVVERMEAYYEAKKEAFNGSSR